MGWLTTRKEPFCSIYVENAPLCACGCGEKVRQSIITKKFNKFVVDHHARVKAPVTKETRRKLSQAAKGRKLSFETIQLMKISQIERIERQLLNNEPMCPSVGTIERECLNTLQSIVPYTIKRNTHEFKKKLGIFPDGYISELNLLIEFDEPRHFIDGKTCLIYKEKDINRARIIINSGLRLFSIKQIDWLKNNLEVMERFKRETECLV